MDAIKHMDFAFTPGEWFGCWDRKRGEAPETSVGTKSKSNRRPSVITRQLFCQQSNCCISMFKPLSL